MKKIVFIIICAFLFSNVSASDINDIAEIKYKWYREEIEELYYPKQYELDGYIEDNTKTKYGDYSYWASGFCNYSKNYYLLEEKNTKIYDKIIKSKYVKFEVDKNYQCDECNYFNEIRVYSGTTLLDYKVVKKDNSGIKITLPQWYEVDTLWFYVDTNIQYNIYITQDEGLKIKSLGYHVIPDFVGKILIPDEKWLLPTSVYTQRFEDGNVQASSFIKNINEEKVCRYREIMTYRYKTEKIYYDDEYHDYIEGYIPDINDYIINYKDGASINVKTVENTKIEKEYVYFEVSNELSNASDLNETKNIDKEKNNVQEKIIYKTKYIDKEIFRIPKIIYLILIILIIIIIILTIRIITKKVD